MTQTEEPPIYTLPDELLLQIASPLRDRTSVEQKDLANLCLVSKKLVPIAQEQLYAESILPIPCGCHPKVNGAVQFLRTVLDRPDLALQVKALRFSIVREQIEELYGVQGFDLSQVRNKCFVKLSEFGFDSSHPWWRSLQNNLESAYGGVLLSILPNLENLDFVVKDLHRGFPTADPLSALFGTSIPPKATVQALAKVHSLAATDLTFVRDVEFRNLRALDLKRVDIDTVLHLNGPNTLQGTTRLERLSLGVSIIFLDEECLPNERAALGNVFAALGCKHLVRLDVMLLLCNGGYSVVGGEREFRADYFMRQLRLVSSNLRTLFLDLEPSEDSEEWFCFFEQMTTPMRSCDFPKLEHLKIPQPFLFQDIPITGDNELTPSLLPQTLQHLDIIAPDNEIIFWVDLLVEEHPRNLKTFYLYCREGFHVNKADYSREVNVVWERLKDMGIYSLTCDETGEEYGLSALYEIDSEAENSEEWEDDVEEDDASDL